MNRTKPIQMTKSRGRVPKRTPRDNLPAIVVEIVLGALCVIVWGGLYAMRLCHWDLWCLLLWAVILVGMGALLFRGERRLRTLLKEREQPREP